MGLQDIEICAELDNIKRQLSGEALVNELVKRCIAAELEKGKLAKKIDEKQKSTNVDADGGSGDLHKQNQILIKKVERLESLLTKTEVAKGKLEDLCREMQKVQRKLNEEHLEKVRSLQRSRDAMIKDFKSSMVDIQKSMDEGKETSQKLYADNASLAEKLKHLSTDCESKVTLLSRQIEEKSECCDKLTATLDMEVEAYKVELGSAKIIIEKLNQEKLLLQNDLLTRELKLKEALEGEKAMREEIERYSKKYNELHSSLNSSNETFGKFKREMERMNSNLIKVEKESRKWKLAYEELSKKFTRICDEKKKADEENAHKERQLQQLQGLCRMLRSQINN